MSFEPSMLVAILPQILLVVLGAVVLVLELTLPEEQQRNIGWVTAVGMGLILLASIPARPAAESGEVVWGGMLRHDWLSTMSLDNHVPRKLLDKPLKL